MAYYLDSTGYLAPRGADFKSVFEARVEAELIAGGEPADIDWSRDTFWGTVSAVFSTMLGELSEGTQAIYDARDVNAAEGVSLHNLGLIVGVTPEDATYSQGEFYLVGTNGTLVPAGSLIETDDANGTYQWELLVSTVIGATDTLAVFRAVDSGDVRAEAADPHTIVTPVAGWSSVYSTEAAAGGQPAESDQEFRQRRQESLQISGSRSIAALRSKLLALDIVTSAAVVDNPTDTDQTIDGILVEKHGMAAVVYPEPVPAVDKETIAEIIYQHLAAGIKSSGDITVNVTGLDGFTKEINFYAGSNVTVDVDIVLDLASGYVLADVQTQAEEAISAIFDAIIMGEDVRLLPIQAAMDDITGIDGITSLTLNAVAADFTIALNEFAIEGTVTVS